MNVQATVTRRRTMLGARMLAVASAFSCLATFATFGLMSNVPAIAADTINGQVLGAGSPIVGSTVTLWAETTGEPRQLAQTQSGADGRFALTADGNAQLSI